ncbi:hypothetical protein F5Y03DRAFT_126864 [Xylaria venustula]|nr:hypothetical protein F5Y03DRAFT_126864 [Xylaria venustula]
MTVSVSLCLSVRLSDCFGETDSCAVGCLVEARIRRITRGILQVWTDEIIYLMSTELSFWCSPPRPLSYLLSYLPLIM